jgi:hypothetical protein
MKTLFIYSNTERYKPIFLHSVLFGSIDHIHRHLYVTHKSSSFINNECDLTSTLGGVN